MIFGCFVSERVVGTESKIVVIRKNHTFMCFIVRALLSASFTSAISVMALDGLNKLPGGGIANNRSNLDGAPLSVKF
jgi:hypothetical protein